jgi:UDP-glucuronate 4-epimerase
MARVLVTGGAGFIGMHVCSALLDLGYEVDAIDDLNSYYEVQLKIDRLETQKARTNFSFHKLDVANHDELKSLFEKRQFEVVIHLAAQAGVRYSIEHPFAYAHANLMGMTSILEACRRFKVGHLLYASSSSVYGGNVRVPFKETDVVDTPVSFYAATKKANEVMAHSYAKLYDVPMTGLRFFTVYGPWGRPDMAYWSFTKALLEGTPIKVFGDGVLSRDFTCYKDVVKSIMKLVVLPPAPNGAHCLADAPHRILNVGNSSPNTVNEMIAILEELTKCKAKQVLLPMPPGDVAKTYADPSALQGLTNFRPATSLNDGLREFVDWYRAYHRV